MKTFLNFLTEAKEEKIVATDATIKDIVKTEIERLGNNADLNHIDVSKVTNMHGLFSYPNDKFNGDISKWNTSKVTDMRSMFYKSVFKGDISKWNVSKVTDMRGMFQKSWFNGDISKWNVSNVEKMNEMFYMSAFTGDITKWKPTKCRNTATHANVFTAPHLIRF